MFNIALPPRSVDGARDAPRAVVRNDLPVTARTVSGITGSGRHTAVSDLVGPRTVGEMLGELADRLGAERALDAV